MTDASKNILLIITGGIAAYKSLTLIRRLRDLGDQLEVVMTKSAHEFVTPLSVGALLGKPPHGNLFDVHSEMDVGHIRLARQADLVIVAPATANIIAQLAQGHAHDLATACLLATRAPILVAPAMNPAMYAAPATQENLEKLKSRGLHFIGPETGEMAEAGEAGLGRMSEPETIALHAQKLLDLPPAPPDAPHLVGKHVLITAGPTHEPIDPVRYIANRSSGKQGYALAEAAAYLGADVTLVSGPTNLDPPFGVACQKVETAQQMLEATQGALPADIAIFCAAVADWRPATMTHHKLKKKKGQTTLNLALERNPDIAATISQLAQNRPTLAIGFAAETDHLIDHARSKLAAKNLDCIVANDVSPGTRTMGGDTNQIHLIDADGMQSWPLMSKFAVAEKLMAHLAQKLVQKTI